MVLSGPGLALCTLYTLYFGGSPLIYSPAPRGDCANCCPLREPRDIKFLLYTRLNPNKSDTLFLSDVKRLEASHLNKTNPVVVYLHGFSESAPGGPGQSSQEVRDAFLSGGDYNVILVDWSALTALPWYVNSVQNSPRVARYLARFIRFLLENGADINKMHLIGFSLGAEVAGFAGKILKEWEMELPRITGLDPAFPLYVFSSPAARLSASDAKFVDIVHTDGGLLGYPWPLGHADFFPNGGTPLQPGCARQEISKNRWLSVVVGCSHQRAWEYFIESVQYAKAFPASHCEPSAAHLTKQSCNETIPAYMGMHADKRLRGKFYLTTNERPPFGRNYHT